MDFCGNGGHWWGFLRLISPEMETALKELQARTDTRGGERVEGTLALVAGEVELYSGKHQSVPAWRTLETIEEDGNELSVCS